jgi:TonB family protein
MSPVSGLAGTSSAGRWILLESPRSSDDLHRDLVAVLEATSPLPESPDGPRPLLVASCTQGAPALYFGNGTLPAGATERSERVLFKAKGQISLRVKGFLDVNDNAFFLPGPLQTAVDLSRQEEIEVDLSPIAGLEGKATFDMEGAGEALLKVVEACALTDCGEGIAECPERILGSDAEIPYPEEARSRGIKGHVLFQMLILPDGRTKFVRVLESPKTETGVILGFEEAARPVLETWRYEPARVEGTPRPMLFTIKVNFKFRGGYGRTIQGPPEDVVDE